MTSHENQELATEVFISNLRKDGGRLFERVLQGEDGKATLGLN